MELGCDVHLSVLGFNLSWSGSVSGARLPTTTTSRIRHPLKRMETGMEGILDVQMLRRGGSFLFTTYFWFVKARRERPSLQCFQLPTSAR